MTRALKRIIVLGAGGQARETEWIIRLLAERDGNMQFAGYVVGDLNSDDAGTLGVVGDEWWLRENRERFDALALGVGMPGPRLRIAAQLLADFDESWWPPLVHPTAIIDRATCRLAPGTMIGAGAIVTVGVTMNAFSFVNFGATVGHESKLGRGCVVGPGANISGGVEIGEGVLIGTGAQVLQYLRIGDRANVGAGAVVTRNVPDGVTVVGIPAREP